MSGRCPKCGADLTRSAASSMAKRRWARLSPEERSAHAKKMVAAREAKRKGRR